MITDPSDLFSQLIILTPSVNIIYPIPIFHRSQSESLKLTADKIAHWEIPAPPGCATNSWLSRLR